MTCTSVWAAIGMLLTLPSFGGGEIGNAKFVPYENALLGVQMLYPESWTSFEVGNVASFMDSPNAFHDSHSSSVSLAIDFEPKIRTSADLPKLARETHSSETKWVAARFAGRDALRTPPGKQGMLLILKSPGEVVTVRHSVQPDQVSISTVEAMLQSIVVD